MCKFKTIIIFNLFVYIYIFNSIIMDIDQIFKVGTISRFLDIICDYTSYLSLTRYFEIWTHKSWKNKVYAVSVNHLPSVCSLFVLLFYCHQLCNRGHLVFSCH